MSFFSPPNKAQGIGLPNLSTSTDVLPAQHTIAIVEGVAHLLDLVTHGDVLDFDIVVIITVGRESTGL